MTKVCESGSWVKLLRSLGRPTRLSLESLSRVCDLTMKNGVDPPYTNWSRAGAFPLMNPRQGKTS